MRAVTEEGMKALARSLYNQQREYERAGDICRENVLKLKGALELMKNALGIEVHTPLVPRTQPASGGEGKTEEGAREGATVILKAADKMEEQEKEKSSDEGAALDDGGSEEKASGNKKKRKRSRSVSSQTTDGAA